MMSLLGDILTIAGTWAFMGQNAKMSTMPQALYEKLQTLDSMIVLLLPLGLLLAVMGRILYVTKSESKVRSLLSALLSFGRLPLFEGIACTGAFIFLYQELTQAETSSMLTWIGITLTLGICLLWASRKTKPHHA